jgi:hypothetical protein
VFETCPRDRWEIAAPGGRILGTPDPLLAGEA